MRRRPCDATHAAPHHGSHAGAALIVPPASQRPVTAPSAVNRNTSARPHATATVLWGAVDNIHSASARASKGVFKDARDWKGGKWWDHRLQHRFGLESETCDSTGLRLLVRHRITCTLPSRALPVERAYLWT